MKAKFLAFAALVLGLASCQSEPEGISAIGSDEVSVVLNVTVPEDITRAGGADSAKGAIGNIDLANDYDVRFILEVYDANGDLAKERFTNYENTATSTAFDLRLVPGRDYKFVVWADFVEQVNVTRDPATNYDLHYNTQDLKNITVNAATWKAMDESRDAYTGYHDAVKFNSTQAINIELKRPFAKLRVVTTDMDDLYNVVPEDVKVTYNTNKLYTTFNAYTSKAVADNAVANLAHEFELSASEYSNDAEGTKTLFADYMFGAENGTVKFTMDVVDTNGGVIPTIVFNTDIPVERNYLTTIIGPVLTDFSNIKVTINDAFDNAGDKIDDLPHYIEIWDGKTINEPKFSTEKNAYIIEKASELAWVAQQVNAGVTRSATANEFSGKKFLLEYDLNLNNEPWTPIGVPGYSNAFNGIIDGQGHKITNLCVTNTKGAGLIGGSEGCTIQNLTIDGVKLATNHYAGAFVAWGESGASAITLTNCHVKNAEIVITPEVVNGKWDNGDKAGGIIGFAHATKIENCSADNVVVTAFRDVAGIAGYASKGSISNCTVKNATITADQIHEYNGEKDGNAGVIVGRTGEPVALNGNNEGENITVIRKVDSDKELEYALADAKSGDTVVVAAGEYAALTGVKDGVIIEATGAIFTGVSNATGDGAKIVGATFKNEFVSEKYCFTGSMTNTTFDNCVFEAYSSARWCYAHGEIVFNNCKFGTEQSWRGIHYDSGEGKVTFNNCDLYGFQAFGGTLEKVTFNECNFFKGRSTNVVNMYGTFEYNDCEFVAEYNCDCAGNGVVAAFNGCSYVDGSDITKIVRFDKDPNTCTITFDGYKYVGEGVIEDENGNLVVNSLQTLETALTAAGAAGAGDTTIVFAENTTLDMTGVEWTPIEVDGYHGADIVTVDGNNSVIKGLTSSLFAGGFAGGSGIVIKNLTIEDSAIVADNTQGYGAFVNNADSMDEITLENCHLINSSIITPNDGANDSRIGGLIGWTSGYNVTSDGPVDSFITVKNCSVIGCTLKGCGSIGGICGHAGANPATYTTIENCTIKNNNLISTDSGWRVGVVVGTANVGVVTINNITESGNTLTQIGETAPTGYKRNYYGRFVPVSDGKLTIDGYEYSVDGTIQDGNGNPVVGTQDVFAEVIKGGATNITLTAGNYTMLDSFHNSLNLQGKNLTITGTKDVVIDATAIDSRDQFVTGANIVFDGVTINFGTTNYMGFANATSLTYKNCDINGLQFLYGPEVTFENCNLNSNGAEHTVWTYGAKKVSFTDCDFKYGDRGVNCYSDNDVVGGQTVNFTSCKFTTNNTASDGAVEINSCYITNGIEVNLTGCTAPAYGELAYVSPWDSTNGAKTTINIK